MKLKGWGSAIFRRSPPPSRTDAHATGRPDDPLGRMEANEFEALHTAHCPPPTAHCLLPACRPDDLLGRMEANEFEASVSQAQERARAARDNPGKESPEEQIVWQDRDDTFAPTPVQSADLLASLELNRQLMVKPGRFYVLMHRKAFEKIIAHLKSDVKIELGGLLVGRVYVDKTLAAYFTVVEDGLPATEGSGTATTFTYTSASWQALTPLLQKIGSDRTIVGSYHSHPGVGVFLSAIDRHTQSAIFDQDWQTALVIDPISNEFGFFVGSSEQPCSDWSFCSDSGRAVVQG